MARPLNTSANLTCHMTPLIHTLCLLPDSHSEIHVRNLPVIPGLSNFRPNLTWNFIKCFCKVHKNDIYILSRVSASSHLVRNSENTRRLVKHERHLRNPCWYSSIRILVSRCWTTAFLMTVSLRNAVVQHLETNILILEWQSQRVYILDSTNSLVCNSPLCFDYLSWR